MFAMFHLGRMDVLPVGDLGIRNGMKLLYGLSVSPHSLRQYQVKNTIRPISHINSELL